MYLYFDDVVRIHAIRLYSENRRIRGTERIEFVYASPLLAAHIMLYIYILSVDNFILIF